MGENSYSNDYSRSYITFNFFLKNFGVSWERVLSSASLSGEAKSFLEEKTSVLATSNSSSKFFGGEVLPFQYDVTENHEVNEESLKNKIFHFTRSKLLTFREGKQFIVV